MTLDRDDTGRALISSESRGVRVLRDAARKIGRRMLLETRFGANRSFSGAIEAVSMFRGGLRIGKIVLTFRRDLRVYSAPLGDVGDAGNARDGVPHRAVSRFRHVPL